MKRLDLISRLQEYDARVGEIESEARGVVVSGPTEIYCPFSDDELNDDASSSHPTRLEATYTRLAYYSFSEDEDEIYARCSALAPLPSELFPAQGQRCYSSASSANDSDKIRAVKGNI
jgi:hypothetical protein